MTTRPSPPMTHGRNSGGTSNDMDRCIEACSDCARICLQTLTTHCLPQGGKHAEAQHIKVMLDCAEICRTSAAFLSRESEFHGVTCGVCSQICIACAESCERIGGEQMKKCAQTCRQCAESCQRMSHATPA